LKLRYSQSPRKILTFNWKYEPLWRTQSAPHFSGYCSGGGANVESTSKCPPAAWT
jgi:hypothetical protein